MGLRAWRNAHGGHTALGRADVRKGSGTVGDHRSKRCDFIACSKHIFHWPESCKFVWKTRREPQSFACSGSPSSTAAPSSRSHADVLVGLDGCDVRLCDP
jgi:hypothetical protein